MDMQSLLQQLKKTDPIYGIRTADAYVIGIQPDPSDLERWQKYLQEASHKLTFSSPDMLVNGKSIAKGEDDTRGVVMRFDAVLTTSRRDRDYDVLATSGASVDPNMPLLWQHNAMQPIGRFVRVVHHTDEELECKFEIGNIELGRDAAVLVEMGALRMSHGFEPDFDQMEILPDGRGFLFRAFNIFEASLVSIPSNVDAVVTAYSKNKLISGMFQRWAKSFVDDRPVIVPGADLVTDDKPAVAEDMTEPVEPEPVVVVPESSPEPAEPEVAVTDTVPVPEDVPVPDKAKRTFEQIERELIAASVKESPDMLRRAAECLRRISEARQEQADDQALEELLSDL